MAENSKKGTSLVHSSHNKIAKLHISQDSKFLSLGFFCKARIINKNYLIYFYKKKKFLKLILPSGDIQAG